MSQNARLSSTLDSFAARLPRKPAVYFYMVIIWVVTLWFLSAGNPAPKDGPEIPHLDKIAHFVYFLCGAAAMTAWMGLKWSHLRALRIFLTVTAVGCVIGRLDEYHQTFTPGRSGNDTGDWLADTLGAATGAWLVVVFLLPRILARTAQSGKKAPNRVN